MQIPISKTRNAIYRSSFPQCGLQPFWDDTWHLTRFLSGVSWTIEQYRIPLLNPLPPPTIGMSKRWTSGSGLKGAELFRAIYTLKELERLSQEEEMEEALGEGVEASQGLAAKVVSEKISDLLATLRAKAEGPLVSNTEFILSFIFPNLLWKTFSFSSIDFDILDEQFNISPGDPLVRQGNHTDRVAESIAQGGGIYMTSEDMYRHLNMLENLVPKTVRLYPASPSLPCSIATTERGGRPPMDRRYLLPGVGHAVRQQEDGAQHRATHPIS